MSADARFAALFRGYSQAYGLFDVRPAPDGAKVKGRAETKREPLTMAQYTAHLAGTTGLGVIMLDDEERCAFVAVDYDNKTVDHAALARKVAALPVVVCRSKSGGAHLYVFFADPADPATALLWIEELRSWLGLPATTELFPKQRHRADANDIGSWINLPYHGGSVTTRYAVHPQGGTALRLEEFLDFAEGKQLPNADALPPLPEQSTLFADGPPCLQAYEALGGFPEGMRNEGMKAVATYVKRRHGPEWETALVEANTVMGQLPLAEISHLAKTYARKDYTYACSKPPLTSHCARKVCLRRPYGIGRSGSGDEEEVMAELDGLVCVQGEPDATGLVNPENTTWYLNVNGKRVRLTTDELHSVSLFNKACLGQIRMLPVMMTPKAWRAKVNELAAVAELQTIPYAATVDGITWTHVQEYLHNAATCTEKRQVHLGGVYVEDGRAHFMLHRLMEFLHARRVPFGTAERLRIILLRHDGQLYQESLAPGSVTPLWSVPWVVAETLATTEEPVVF